MDRGVSAIQELTPGVPWDESSAFEQRRSVSGPDLLMLESIGGPGQVMSQSVPYLILSQALCHSFHYHCDLGAGCFSGQGIPQDFVVAVPEAPTWCRIDNPHRLRFLAIPMPLARRLLVRSEADPLDFGALHSRHNRDPFISQTLEALWSELALDDPNSSLFLETTVASVLARLERLETQPCESQARVCGLTHWQSDRVLEYMRAHLAEPVSLSELAELVDLSPWHFARAFRQRHKMPPHRCLTRLRLEKARELLVHSRLSITEVAAASGYSSQHLARQFRQALGCTPGEYRRQNSR